MVPRSASAGQPSPRKPPSLRRQKATATRRRVIAAAYELFCERGFEPTTMEDIAERAGVAVQTLYFTFGTKAGILRDVAGAAIVGIENFSTDLEPAVIADHRAALRQIFPWFRALEREPDRVRALAHYVRGQLDVLERIAPLAAVLAASRAPEVRVVIEDAEVRRVESVELVLDALDEKSRSAVRTPRARARRVDVVLAITSPELYAQLVLRRRWPRRRAESFITEVLAMELFGPRPSSAIATSGRGSRGGRGPYGAS